MQHKCVAYATIHAADVATLCMLTTRSWFMLLTLTSKVLRKLRVSPRVLYTGAVDAPQTLGLLTWLDQGFEGASNPIPQIDWVAIRQLGDSPMRAKVLICISAEMAPQV